MKRSDAVRYLADQFYHTNMEPEEASEKALEVLAYLEWMGMQPKKYVNPKAFEDDISFERGDAWAYIEYISKYPEHYYSFKNERPYEFYLEGWEDE